MTNASLTPCANCGSTPELDELVITCPCGNYANSTKATEPTRYPADPSLALVAFDGAMVFDPSVP